MFCPHCGAQQPDGAVFCSVCGQQMTDQAAGGAQQSWGAQPTPTPQQVWNQPGYTAQSQPVQGGYQQVPGYQAQPGVYPGATAAAPKASPFANFRASALSVQGTVLGRRSLVLTLGAILVVVFMLQGWLALPIVDKATDMSLQGSYSTSWGVSASDVSGAVNTLVKNDQTAPGLLGLAGVFSMFKTIAQNTITAASSYSSTIPGMSQVNDAINGLGMVAFVLRIVFVLWLVCFVGLLAGIVVKLARGNDMVLFLALCATAVVSLLFSLVVLIVNGQIEGALDNATTALGSYFGSSSVSQLSSLKPFIAPGIGAILSLLGSVATIVGSLFVKE